ncbi:hypothetical protein GBAR_LOCUS26488 [Geodia barretti]|nr:hypothetical protein GBAR_LOCUS26488 [Geodia barretti]
MFVRDHDIIRCMLQDGNYDLSVEVYAALQMTISQDGFHTPSSTDDDGMDAHDCEILQSILNDGNYEMSADDVATLETVISTLTLPTPVTDLCQFSSEENTSCDESQILSVTNESDSAILQSILDDRNYEIADEDRAALHGVIKILITGGSVFDVTNKATRITHMNNDYKALRCGMDEVVDKDSAPVQTVTLASANVEGKRWYQHF